MNPIEPVRCRRCDRPLRAPLAVAAGHGPRCAQLAQAEAAEEPQTASLVRSATEVRRAALAVTTLAANPTPTVSVAELLDGIDAHDVTAALADQLAGALRIVLGDQVRMELLHEIGVRLAEAGE